MTPTARAKALTVGVVMLLSVTGCSAAVYARPEPSYKALQAPFSPVVVSTPTPDLTASPEPSVAPTPRPTVRIISGRASWYDNGPGLYAAAGPVLRSMLGRYWRGLRVSVCTASDTCVSVRLTDWCQCYKGQATERLIDLSPDAFARLAPLSRGLVAVTLRP